MSASFISVSKTPGRGKSVTRTLCNILWSELDVLMAGLHAFLKDIKPEIIFVASFFRRRLCSGIPLVFHLQKVASDRNKTPTFVE